MNLGPLANLLDVIATLKDWVRAVPDEFSPRWTVSPVYVSKAYLQVNQLARFDTTVTSLTATVPAPTATLKGRELAVMVIAGTNAVTLTVADGSAFGARGTSLVTTNSVRLICAGNQWGAWV